jgi:hypothetical protein
VKNRLLIVVSILLVALAAAPTFAGSKKKKASPAPKYQPPVISIVAGNRITVTEDKVTRAFTITRFSEIMVNGQRATIADLKPGMTVSITIGVDPSQASRVVATGVPGDGKKKWDVISEKWIAIRKSVYERTIQKFSLAARHGEYTLSMLWINWAAAFV